MADSAGALAQLQQFQSSMVSPDQAIQNANAALGVQGAQQQVTGLRQAINQTTGLLNQVAPGVMGRTQNSLVTSAQANRQIQNEQAPIQQNLSKDQTDLDTANASYTDLQNQANQRAQATLSGQTGQLSYLQSIYQDMYQREQDAQAEADRQQQMADARKASSAGSGGLDLSPLLGAAAASAGQPAAQSPDQFFSLIKQIRNDPSTYHYSWGQIAGLLSSEGFDTSHGSAADQALNRYFGG